MTYSWIYTLVVFILAILANITRNDNVLGMMWGVLIGQLLWFVYVLINLQ